MLDLFDALHKESGDRVEPLLGARECWTPSDDEGFDGEPFLLGQSSDGDIRYNSHKLQDWFDSVIPREFDTDDSDVFEDSYDMGNIQGAEGKKLGKAEKQKVKEKGRGRLARGKSPSKGKLHESRDTLHDGDRGAVCASPISTPSTIAAATVGISTEPHSIPVPVPTVAERPTSIVTDSWKEARKPKPLGVSETAGGAAVAFADSSSSSESVFTEARSGAGTNSQHDAFTPAEGATTPLFTEALDLPIDEIMSGQYSSSATSTASSKPPTVAESVRSTSSATDDLSKKTPPRWETEAYVEILKKTESGEDTPEKTLVRPGERGGRTPEAAPPHPAPTQVDKTDTRVEASQQIPAHVHTPYLSSEQHVREAAVAPDDGAGSVSSVDVLGPDSVDLYFSVSASSHSEFDESVEEYSGARLVEQPPRHPAVTNSSGEESVGSFICVNLEPVPSRPKTQSLGDVIEDQDDPQDSWSPEGKPRSYSADDIELEDYDDDYYTEEDMPQASAAAAGRGGGSSAFRVSRHRKVELQPAKPSATRPGNNNNNTAARNRALSENCIAGEYNFPSIPLFFTECWIFPRLYLEISLGKKKTIETGNSTTKNSTNDARPRRRKLQVNVSIRAVHQEERVNRTWR